jgi:hypothetical protein
VSTKKFPTPNLDAVAAITTIPAMLHMEMLRAIQADIALAVSMAVENAERAWLEEEPESARAMVSDDVQEAILSAADLLCSCQHPERSGTKNHERIISWLELLAVAPKEAQHLADMPIVTSPWITPTGMPIAILASEKMQPGEVLLTDGKTAVKMVNIGEPEQDKRCGTCAHFGATTSECLLPMAGDKLIEVSPEFGRKCECWKVKP